MKNILFTASAASSLLGLVLIYFSSINIKPVELEVSDLSFDYVGKVVTVTGQIVYKKEHPAGHIFLTLSDGRNKIQVPIFSGLAKSLDDGEVTREMLKYKKQVVITGTVDEYNGELQVVPRKVEDVVIGDEKR